MCTRSSSSNFVGEPSKNPTSTSTNTKRRNRRRSKQRVEPFALEEIPVVTMADQRTMAELLRAPTKGYAKAIVPVVGLKKNPLVLFSLGKILFPFINPEEDEHVEETLTDPEHGEFTIKVPPPLVQKAKPPSQRNYVVHQRDPCHPHIPYPSRMNQEKQKEKDEKLLELANTPLNENFSAVILKKLPEKLGDPGKFLIPCGFSKLKCKALDDLDVFVPVGKFTLPADFIIVDYESDPCVPLILGRPFMRTARALINVHGEEMILRDGDERLILNMRNDTSRYSNKPQKESINMIDIYNISHKEYLKDLFATNHQSGNLTFSSHTDLTSPGVINLMSGNPTPTSETVTKSSSSPTLTSIEESDLIWEEFKAYLASDSFPPGNSNPLSHLPPFHNSLSGSTTSSSPSLLISETSDYSLEEFPDELAHFTFPPGIDYLPFDAESDLREIEYLLNHDPIKKIDSILKDSVDSPDDNLVDTIITEFSVNMLLINHPTIRDDYDDKFLI
ncbi:reverse transcriptase domain-containing protein [Tanacetum coccineum]